MKRETSCASRRARTSSTSHGPRPDSHACGARGCANDRAHEYAIISDVTYGVGLVGVGVGAYFLYKGARERTIRRRSRSRRRMAACSSQRSSRGEVACRPRARGRRRVHAVRQRSARRLVLASTPTAFARKARRASTIAASRRPSTPESIAHEARDRSRLRQRHRVRRRHRRPNGISARGVGMGGACHAFADDATAVYFNPGALDDLDSQVMVGGELVYGPRTYTPSRPTARGRRARHDGRRAGAARSASSVALRQRRSTVAVHARLRRVEHVRRRASATRRPACRRSTRRATS